MKNISMTEGGLKSGILRFGIPLILTNMLRVLFNIFNVLCVCSRTPTGAAGILCFARVCRKAAEEQPAD